MPKSAIAKKKTPQSRGQTFNARQFSSDGLHFSRQNADRRFFNFLFGSLEIAFGLCKILTETI
ncbi:MAG: hypothetical protein AB7U61_10765 [Methylocystis sp.]